MEVSKIQLNENILEIKDTVARDHVTELDDNTSYKNDDKIIIMSDSYGITPTTTTSWTEITKNLCPDKNIVSIVKGGCGFGWGSSSEYDFKKLIENNPVDDPEKVKTILLLAGANDGNLIYDGLTNTNTIDDGINRFVTFARNVYTNAIIFIGFVGRYADYLRINAYNTAENVYSKCGKYPKTSYARNFNYIMHRESFLSTIDSIHPTQEGANAIGRYAAEFIRSGSIMTEDEQRVYFDYNGRTPSTSYEAREYIQNGTSHLKMWGSTTGVNATWNCSGSPLTLNPSTLTQLFNIIGDPLIKGGNTETFCVGEVHIALGKSTGEIYYVDMPVIIQNSKLYLLNTSATAYTNITAVVLYDFDITLNSKCC